MKNKCVLYCKQKWKLITADPVGILCVLALHATHVGSDIPL